MQLQYELQFNMPALKSFSKFSGPVPFYPLAIVLVKRIMIMGLITESYASFANRWLYLISPFLA